MTTMSMQATAQRDNPLRRAWRGLTHLLDWLQAPALLSARLYVAYVFFASGGETGREWSSMVNPSCSL